MDYHQRVVYGSILSECPTDQNQQAIADKDLTEIISTRPESYLS
jgi:hypothetical protein